jgi:class 3 adenylate cyclase/tetratricopeptide (TPR) repeat protein
MDIGAWLTGAGFGHLAEAFARHRIDAETLLQLDAGDLKELGIEALGDRKRLLAAIAALRESAVVAPATPPPAAAPQDEQRPVSVLFADLTGFTALSRRLGAEATSELLQELLTALDGEVLRFGGSVDKHIGDAVMAVFGLPVAHGDDPERAARAALAMIDAATRVGAARGEALALHVGIGSGLVVAARTTAEADAPRTVTGDAVNLAARLCDRAPPGTVLVDDETHDRLAGRAVSEAFGRLELKGFEHEMAAWRLREIVARQAPTPRPFVGRRAELGQFDAALAAAGAGSGAVVVLRGEPGIGKSRLAEEFRRRARDAGFHVHDGAFADFGGAELRDGIGALAQDLLAIAPGGVAEERRAMLAAAVAAGLVEPAHEIFAAELAGVPQAPAQRALFDAMDPATRERGATASLNESVARAAAASPRLLVVEDVHWAEPRAVERLAALGASLGEQRVLLLLTTRVDGDPLGEAWRARLAGVAFLRIEIGPLRQAEAEALARAIGTDIAGRIGRCLERAAGHPLFLEQLLQHSLAGGDEGVPGTVQSIVHARMDRLPTLDRAALQGTAVLGLRAALDAVRHLLERFDWQPDTLVGQALLRADDGELAFTHALVRDGAYGSLLNARRRVLHRRAAAWFATRDATLLAEHLDRAGEPGAAAAYLAAARGEMERHHLAAASRMARRGLEIAREPGDRHALAALLGDALRELGDAAAAIAAYDGALAAARDDSERARSLLGRAGARRLADRIDEAVADVDAALPLAESIGALELQAELWHLRGNLHFPRGETAACRAAHERAQALAERAGSPALKALALGGLGDAAFAGFELTRAFARFRDCVALARAHGLKRIEVANAPMMVLTHAFVGPLDGLADEGERVAAAALAVGHRRSAIIAQHATILAAIWGLDLARAERAVDAAQALTREIAAHRFVPENLAFLGMIRNLQDRRVEARTILDEAWALARASGPGFIGPIVLGAMLGTTTDAGEQARLHAEAEKLLGPNALAHNRFLFNVAAIDAALERRDAAAARQAAERLGESFRGEAMPSVEFLVERAQALAAACDGALDPDRLAASAAQGARLGYRAFVVALDAAIAAARR